MSRYTGKEKTTNVWDHANVIGRDKSMVDIFTAKAICTHVLCTIGVPLKAPTIRLVEKGDEDVAHTNHAWAAMDDDGTMMYFFRPQNPTTVVLHELAHLLVDDPLDAMELRKPQESEMHGPVWLTNYLWLLDRFMGPSYNTFYLRSTMPVELKPNELPYHPIIWGKPKVGL